MNREESIAHFEKIESVRKAALDEGKSQEEAHKAAKSAWNEWAERLLAERKILVRNREWKTRSDLSTNLIEVGLNDKTKAWFDRAKLDFNTLRFALVFFEFKAQGVENKPSGVKSIYSESASINFSGYIFPANADFSSATFSGTADFYSSTFNSTADFRSATFSSYADFISAIFSGYTTFAQAEFKSYANFSEAKFNSQVNFHAIESHVSFNLSHARFRHVPDFLNAKFREEEPPNLDNAIVEKFAFWETKEDTATKFRKLKKMAIQAHYNKGELEFHAQELRAERFTWYSGWPISEKWFSKYIKTKQVLIPKVWRVSFWFTLMYELFSDFGRSVFRPIISWALLLFICANIYLCYHPTAKENISNAQDLGSLGVAFTAWDNWFEPMPCLKPNLQKDSTSLAALLLADTTPQLEAFSLSLKNGFVFIDWDRSEAAMQTFGCLYGLNETKTTLVPSVPPVVSFVNIIQNVLSVLLIFLFGLGVRNMLKLK